jgi:hypothetical protein
MHVAHLWPARLYHIFPHYLINGTIFGKTLLNITCVLIFSTNLPGKCLILRRIKLHMIKMYIGIHVKYPLFLSDLIKLEFYQHIFENYPNIKFHENLSSGSRVVPCGRTNGQTDRYDEVNSFSQFCEKRHKSLNTCHCHCTWFYYSKFCSAQFRITLSHYTEFKIEHQFPIPNSLNKNYTRKFCKLFICLFVHCVIILLYKT